jgi:hypothetical protein
MPTFDMTYGRVAGVQSSGPLGHVNIFELDFEDLVAEHPTVAAADIITIGKLKKGMTVLPGFAEVVEASTTAGVTDLDIQNGSATKIYTSLGIDTADEIKGASLGAGAFFGSTGVPVQLAADTNVNVLIGATLPLDGKIRVSFPVFQGANFD